MHFNDQTIDARALDAAKIRALLMLSLGAWFVSGPHPRVAETFAFALDWLAETAPETAFLFKRLRTRLNADENTEALSEAERDFARVFCVGKELFPSSESAFRTGLLMQEPRDEMRRWMVANGLDHAPDERTPEDHLGMELTFGYHLLKRVLAADEAYEARLSTDVGREDAVSDEIREAEERFEAYVRERLTWPIEAEPLIEALPEGVTKDLLWLTLFVVEARWPSPCGTRRP